MPKFLFIFFLFFFPLAALGHDLYYFYEHQDEGFKFSEVGWLWHTYHPDSHNKALEIVGVPPWKSYITPILSMKSLILGLSITAFMLFVMLAVNSLKMIASSTRARMPKHKQRDSSVGRTREKGQKFEYKRR